MTILVFKADSKVLLAKKMPGTKQRCVVILLKPLFFSGKEMRVVIGEDVRWVPDPISARM